jgi:hypothetical protein
MRRPIEVQVWPTRWVTRIARWLIVGCLAVFTYAGAVGWYYHSLHK